MNLYENLEEITYSIISPLFQICNPVCTIRKGVVLFGPTATFNIKVKGEKEHEKEEGKIKSIQRLAAKIPHPSPVGYR